MTPEKFSVYVGIVKSIATLAAMIIGALWSYNRFIKGREPFPRAHIEHRVFVSPIDGNKMLIRVSIEIENIGNSLFQLGGYDIRLNQVLPLTPEAASQIEQIEVPSNKSKKRIYWKTLSQRLADEEEIFELEPGEKDEKYFDFIVDNSLELVEIYSYFKNIIKKNRQLGWGKKTFHELNPSKEVKKP